MLRKGRTHDSGHLTVSEDRRSCDCSAHDWNGSIVQGVIPDHSSHTHLQDGSRICRSRRAGDRRAGSLCLDLAERKTSGSSKTGSLRRSRISRSLRFREARRRTCRSGTGRPEQRQPVRRTHLHAHPRQSAHRAIEIAARQGCSASVHPQATGGKRSDGDCAHRRTRSGLAGLHEQQAAVAGGRGSVHGHEAGFRHNGPQRGIFSQPERQ